MTDSLATPDLRPNLAVLIGAGGALALVSAAFLPWPVAIASTVLGVLMIAGADVDARTYLLPDVVTFGATLAGIVAQQQSVHGCRSTPCRCVSRSLQAQRLSVR
jgi:leader peptidase (prepilin peptidase)/N-methyltransferase